MQNKRSPGAIATDKTGKKRRKTEQVQIDTTALTNSPGDTSVPQGQGFVGSGRQAAQGVDYKEKSSLVGHDSKVIIKQEQVADSEAQAVQNTKSEGSGIRR